MAGFSRGRKLKKVGLSGQDTAELSFEDVFIPDENSLGAEGGGLGQLKHHLPLERLAIAAQGMAAVDAVLATTVDYTRDRQAFGQRVADFQNTLFTLARLATEADVSRSFLDDVIRSYE